MGRAPDLQATTAAALKDLELIIRNMAVKTWRSQCSCRSIVSNNTLAQ
jgi:hypothetical protein